MVALKGRAEAKKDVDMTQGSIVRHLLAFALPLMAGNLFQQLYNTVDAWVVGNFASNEAFSAVGATSAVINSLIGFFSGLSTGAGVVISQYYGAKKYDRVQDAVHTSVAMTLILGVIFTALGIGIVPVMIKFMRLPVEVIPETRTYLIIYFAGVIGIMLYNIGAGILRAVGDSTRPFYFLVVSAVINTVLDLILVIVFKLGVAGVAYATIASQGVAAILVIITMMRSKTCVKFSISKLRIHMDMLGKVIKMGIPTGLRMSITSFSNVFVQSYINVFGADCMGGWTAYSKIDQLVLLPMQSISMASTAFVGQNLGANQQERARHGANTAVVMAMLINILLTIPVFVFAEPLVGFFNSKPEVVQCGAQLLRWLTPFYTAHCVNQIYSGTLCGAGNSRSPMILMLFSFVVFRQIYLYIMSHFIMNAMVPIAMGYPAGWMMASILIFICYKRTDLTKTRVVE